MTLVIVKRDGERVSFSADSRISFGDAGYMDKGIKLFAVPFRIKEPASSKADFDKWAYETQFGLAVVGSSINAYSVKDAISEVLNNITVMTNLSDLSIPSIGALVFKVYKGVSEELVPILQKNGLSEIILGGYCLHEKRVRIMRLFATINPDNITYDFEEILTEDGLLFFGSGSKLGEEVSENEPGLTPLQIIKKVILSEKDKAVGGALQFGSFNNEIFKISGIIERQFDKEGKILKETKYRRGFIIQNDIQEALKPPYLYISYGYQRVDFTLDNE
ncbi:hypothetical protein INP83_07075 [Mucilaginibacter sp. 21P]|uniref:hypothetical protein n=1 Tax=Mucilaginibacter sp. 21P TaxID=2778902 RepID=UPI001C5829F0|nr:hypothetical protein [Mucilaginibacter sp. 21P]QXV66839.1 hypothetical protein INP83_07075 [Mucilaginibacter sp. 21P]